MPPGQVIFIRVLLRLLDRRSQFGLVELVDELGSIFLLSCHNRGVPPFLGQDPDLDLPGFGCRNQPIFLRDVLQPSDLSIEGLQQIYVTGYLQMDLPSTAFQKVMLPSALPVITSVRLADQVMALIFSLPFRVAFSLASFSRPGLSRSKTLISPCSKQAEKR